MTIDELLCKFQGKCWHEWKNTYLDNGHTVSTVPTKVCKKCGCEAGLSYSNPDFSDDHTAMELLRWIEENKLNMWKAFIEWARPAYVHWCWDYLLLLWVNNKVDADSKSYMRWVVLLAEWLRLEETREKWGWEECPNCEQGYAIRKVGDRMEGTTDRCQYCNGTGKIRAEWAKGEEG